MGFVPSSSSGFQHTIFLVLASLSPCSFTIQAPLGADARTEAGQSSNSTGINHAAAYLDILCTEAKG